MSKAVNVSHYGTRASAMPVLTFLFRAREGQCDGSKISYSLVQYKGVYTNVVIVIQVVNFIYRLCHKTQGNLRSGRAVSRGERQLYLYIPICFFKFAHLCSERVTEGCYEPSLDTIGVLKLSISNLTVMLGHALSCFCVIPMPEDQRRKPGRWIL
jgi:hypothetical protein